MAATKVPKRPDQVGGGKPGPGRPKGTGTPGPRGEIARLLKRLKLNPIEGMARLAMGPIPCNVCAGGMIGRMVKDPKTGNAKKVSTPCDVCKGTGFIAASPTQRADLMKELAQYTAPKRKATEVTGEDGGPLKFEFKWAGQK